MERIRKATVRNPRRKPQPTPKLPFPNNRGKAYARISLFLFPVVQVPLVTSAFAGVLESEFERGFKLPPAGDFSSKRGYHAVPVQPHIEIAYALRALRNGHSQSEIARRLGISYQSYQKLENPRKCNPTVKTLEKIGAVLGKRLSVSWT